MKLILPLKQLSLGHCILFLGDKWTGYAMGDFSTEETGQCKEAHFKPPATSLGCQHCCNLLLGRMLKVSISQASSRTNRSFFSPFIHGHYWEWQPPRHTKNRVCCWASVSASSSACLPGAAWCHLVQMGLIMTALKSCTTLIVHIRLKFLRHLGRKIFCGTHTGNLGFWHTPWSLYVCM